MNQQLHIDFFQSFIVILGYILTIATSGVIVRHFVGRNKPPPSNTETEKTIYKKNYDLGAIIGKCENILTITLILANAVTGLALIFAAKSIVRSESIKKEPKYYLGGTLVNFTYSVLMGFVIRILLLIAKHPLGT
jgi:hypothetical protein